jgi:RNA polymerase sigma-70 factor (ECF subfamily)
VTTNACLDELRRRRRRPVPDALGVVDRGDDAWSDPLDRIDGRRAGGDANVGGAVGGPAHGDIEAAVADRLEVDEAVARLAPEFRAAVVLRDLCDLDYAEIARILDLPPGTVRSRIARGRGQLADLLGNRADPSERPTPAP